MILRGDARALPLDDHSVDCVVTSPPYWGLRDYDVDGQIGLEDSLPEYFAELLAVFRETRRVLRPAGVMWVNMGDRYVMGSASPQSGYAKKHPKWHARNTGGRLAGLAGVSRAFLPRKNLMGLPWRLALMLQDDGWILRCDAIWEKPSVMPETVSDRPTRAHDYLFLFSQQERYWYDAEAIKEPCTGNAHPRGKGTHPKSAAAGSGVKANASFSAAVAGTVEMRNARSIWRIQPHQHHGEHKATFPPELVYRCLLAGCPPGGTALDPFLGSGTLILAARACGRTGIGVELAPHYCREAQQRLAGKTWRPPRHAESVSPQLDLLGVTP